MLKLQFDWYITVRLFSTRSDHSTPNHLSGHKLCLFLLRLKYYKQREMSKKIITDFKKMIFSLLPFHAGSPFSLFFKVVSPVSLIFSGRFSLLPKPFLSPLYSSKYYKFSFYIFLISINCVPKLVWDFPRLCGLDTLIKFIIIIIIRRNHTSIHNVPEKQSHLLYSLTTT